MCSIDTEKLNVERKVVAVGSRKSQLALIQSRFVINSLKKIHANVDFEIVEIQTVGDKILDKALPKIGEKSLFTKELEEALSLNKIDFIVHSLKDLPTSLPANMCIAAILKRDDPRDVLILSKKYQDMKLVSLPKGSIIGSSSLRRSSQLARKHPHIIVESIRGNLNTRLRKLDETGSKYAGIILAAAGIQRMNWQNRISEILDSNEMLYAVGQGALAVECRVNDVTTISLLKGLNDTNTALKVVAERTFLKSLGGGCSAPVGVWSDVLENERVSLRGGVWSLDGKIAVSHTMERSISMNRSGNNGGGGDPSPAKKLKLERENDGLICGVLEDILDDREMLLSGEKLGYDLAQYLIAKGALDIVNSARNEILSSMISDSK